MVSETGVKQDAAIIDLQLEHISKRFGTAPVVRDLSLEVYRGEICCLLGPSGCGKTTTLKIVAGLLEPDSGIVRLAGRDITKLPPQRRDLGMVFQNYALFPHMTVHDNVAYGLRQRRIARNEVTRRVAESLRLVQLVGYESRRIHELSGGEQQRVALGRALVIEPRALLLDEPLSNLDARLRWQMRDEIRRIQRTLGITALHVTHDQEEALSMADRVVVMRQGVIEQIGSPREVYERPATQFVADFIGQVNFLHGHVEGGWLWLFGKRFRLADSGWSNGSEVICALRPERVGIEAVKPEAVNGVIEDARFFGAKVLYRVAVDDTDSTRLSVEVASHRAIHDVGQRVALTFDFEGLHLL